jgi:hypothetical protein
MLSLISWLLDGELEAAIHTGDGTVLQGASSSRQVPRHGLWRRANFDPNWPTACVDSTPSRTRGPGTTRQMCCSDSSRKLFLPLRRSRPERQQ